MIVGKKPSLSNVKFRPGFQGKGRSKCEGSLECHNNGFRFISNKKEELDILLDNIKYCIM